MDENLLTDLRNYIKALGNDRVDTDVTIVNGDRQKTLKLKIDEAILNVLREKVGNENVILD